MNKINTPLINELLNTPNHVEIIRYHIAAILSLEIQNQNSMAGEHKNEYIIPVYVENGRPYTAAGDKPLMRFINVILSKAAPLGENSRIGNQKEQAVFWIDCAACGNDAGDFRDDKSAAFRAWKVARIVRRIVMAEAYMYLGLRGIVGSRVIASMEAGTPGAIDGNSALAYVIIRITLHVQFLERSVFSNMETLDGIDFDIASDSGEVTAILGE